jgi:hypothetical protein
MDCCRSEEVDDDTVEVELFRLFGGFCKLKSSSLSSSSSPSSSDVAKKSYFK